MPFDGIWRHQPVKLLHGSLPLRPAARHVHEPVTRRQIGRVQSVLSPSLLSMECSPESQNNMGKIGF
jgi:hypothetical protein